MRPLEILIAGEYSGTFRDAFLALGHNAISCDLLPTERPDGPHYQGDVRDLLTGSKRRHFDLMVAHPSCTFLCNSGVRWLYNADGSRNEERWANMALGASFFRQMLDAPVEFIAVENPVMHRYAKELIGWDFEFSTQPWEHGHPEVKRTCWWLKNLPPVLPSNVVDGRQPKVHFASPGPDRWKERSRSYPGMAAACARTWVDHIEAIRLERAA